MNEQERTYRVLSVLAHRQALQKKLPIGKLAKATGLSDSHLRVVLRGTARMRKSYWSKLEAAFPALRGMAHFPTPVRQGERFAEPTETALTAYKELVTQGLDYLFDSDKEAGRLPLDPDARGGPAKRAAKRRQMEARKAAEVTARPPALLIPTTSPKRQKRRAPPRASARARRAAQYRNMPLPILRRLFHLLEDKTQLKNLMELHAWATTTMHRSLFDVLRSLQKEE